ALARTSVPPPQRTGRFAVPPVAAPLPYRPQTEGGEGLDVQRYLMLLFERRYVLLAFVAVGMMLAFLWTATQPKIYEARSKVIFKPGTVRIQGGEIDTSPGNYYLLQDQLQTSRQELLSDSLARRAALRLDLLKDASFTSGAEPPKTPQK